MNTPPDYNSIYSHKCDLQLKEETLQFLINTHNIKTALSQMLYILKEFNIVFLCDDSGSMNTKNTYTDLNGTKKQTTRWEEAKEFVCNILDFAIALDDDGIDLFFLNRPYMLNVHDKHLVMSAFEHPPSGSTPIVKQIEKIYESYSNSTKKILLLVITDGLPDEPESQFRSILTKMLNHPTSKFHISLMLATDEEQTVELYNKIDKDYDMFDVCDDFLSEYYEIIQVQKKDFKFTKGDYYCKFLLSTICSDLDKLDEKKIDLNKVAKYFTETYDQGGFDKINNIKKKKSNCVIM